MLKGKNVHYKLKQAKLQWSTKVYENGKKKRHYLEISCGSLPGE